MSDESVRSLERRAREGDPRAATALLAERVRSGVLPVETLALAGVLDAPDGAPPLAEWLRAIDGAGRQAIVRATHAVARASLPVWAASANEGEAPSALVAAIESWIDSPGETGAGAVARHESRLRGVLGHLGNPKASPAREAAIAVLASAVAVRSARPTAAGAAISPLSEGSLREAVRSGLRSWILDPAPAVRPTPLESAPATARAGAAWEQWLETAFGFEVLGVVSPGTYDIVLWAVDRHDGRPVMLKVFVAPSGEYGGIGATLAADPALNQARPGIARLTRVGVNEGRSSVFFAQEHVRGRDLTAWAAEKPRSVGEKVSVIRDACSLVALVQETETLTLRSDKLWLREGTDELVIGDVGIPHRGGFLDEGPMPFDRTWLHEPPEVLASKAVQVPRARVWHLGLLLHGLVSARPPWPGEGGTLVRAIHGNDPAPPDVPDPLAGVILKALARRPEDRFATPSAFASALERCV